MRLFCLQLEASCLQWSFLLTIDNFSFFAYSWSFSAYSFSFSAYSWSFFAYSGKVLLIRALRDCKQRSLTVSKKAPTVSKKPPPIAFHIFCCCGPACPEPSLASGQGCNWTQTLFSRALRAPRIYLGPATTQNLVVKFDGEISDGLLVEYASDDIPSKRSSKISFQTSPEVRHQFRRRLRQLDSGNRWCLCIPLQIPGYPAKMGFEGRIELSDPTPLSGRPPTHSKIEEPNNLSLFSVFLPDPRTSMFKSDI